MNPITKNNYHGLSLRERLKAVPADSKLSKGQTRPQIKPVISRSKDDINLHLSTKLKPLTPIPAIKEESNIADAEVQVKVEDQKEL